MLQIFRTRSVTDFKNLITISFVGSEKIDHGTTLSRTWVSLFRGMMLTQHGEQRVTLCRLTPITYLTITYLRS